MVYYLYKQNKQIKEITANYKIVAGLLNDLSILLKVQKPKNNGNEPITIKRERNK
jgi:hypothetical protein